MSYVICLYLSTYVSSLDMRFQKAPYIISHQFHQCCVQNWWPTTASGSRAMFDFDDLETTAPWIRCGLMGSFGHGRSPVTMGYPLVN